MENGSKKRGRPKTQPQTGPLVLEGSRALVKVEMEISETTAEALQEYTRWVELSSSVTTKDALSKTVDFALRDVFKRDRLWQEYRRKGAEPAAPAPAPKLSTPVSSPAALPPPTNGARSVPSPGASVATR